MGHRDQLLRSFGIPHTVRRGGSYIGKVTAKNAPEKGYLRLAVNAEVLPGDIVVCELSSDEYLIAQVEPSIVMQKIDGKDAFYQRSEARTEPLAQTWNFHAPCMALLATKRTQPKPFTLIE